MLISDLMVRLDELQREAGDVFVEVLNCDGVYNVVEGANLIELDENSTMKWRVFITSDDEV